MIHKSKTTNPAIPETKMQKLRDIDEKAWDASVVRKEGESFFHLFAWKSVIEQSFGFQHHYLCSKDHAGSINGTLPLFFIDSRLTGKRLVSLAFSYICGPLGDSKETVESLDPDIERVDMTEIYKENAISNVYLAGPRRVEELGTYFSAIVASVGIVLVVSTLIRSRIKEYTIMSIRGYSPRQLATSLLVDNLGMDLLAILLELFVGYVSLVGSTEIFNATLFVGITRKVVFPFSAKLRLSIIIGLLLASTIIPILVAVNRISKNPDLKLEE